MATKELMENISKHLTEALMFHSQMIDYFSFLGLWGFCKLHQYQYFDESIGKVKFHALYINEYNEILSTKDIKGIDVIPLEWYGENRLNINKDKMDMYTKLGWKAYIEWEENTKKLYEETCKQLMINGRMSEYNIVNKYLKDVSNELIEIYQIQQELINCGYDETYILDMQDKIYNKYEEKMKHLKV